MANGCSVTTASRKMMVRPANKMFSAISFGVFCRSAPSTKAIMRSRKVSPGFDVTFTLMWSESTRETFHQGDHAIEEGFAGIRRHFHFDVVREHARSAGNRGAIASRLANDRGRFASDCGLVHRGDAIDNFSIRRYEFSRGYQNYVSGTQLRTLHLLRAITLHDAVRDGLCTRLPKCVVLRFAATLGHGFGKVGEQHGEPQPQCDLQIKAKILGVAEQQNGGEHTANLHDEHDRVTHHVTWIQLDKRIQDRAPHDLALPDRFRFRFISCHVGSLRTSYLLPSAGALELVPG